MIVRDKTLVVVGNKPLVVVGDEALVVWLETLIIRLEALVVGVGLVSSWVALVVVVVVGILGRRRWGWRLVVEKGLVRKVGIIVLV